MVGVLAALKAGGAYTVIDPREPVGEIGRLLARVRAGTVVTHDEFRPRVDGRVVLLDPDVRSPEPPDTSGGGTAAVLFTASATGDRRAVHVGHALLRATYDAWAEVYSLSSAVQTPACGRTDGEEAIRRFGWLESE